MRVTYEGPGHPRLCCEKLCTTSPFRFSIRRAYTYISLKVRTHLVLKVIEGGRIKLLNQMYHMCLHNERNVIKIISTTAENIKD